MEDDDSNVYEQADSIYETILDSESPYSHPSPHPPPPLPIPNNTLPFEEQQNAAPATGGNPEPYSKTQFFPSKDLSKRCPSPVDYSLLNPNAALSLPGRETEYASVNDTACIASQLNTGDDYVPMYDGTVAKEGGDSMTARSAYQNIARESLDKENDYQVPRPVKPETEGQEEGAKHHYANFVAGMKTQ